MNKPFFNKILIANRGEIALRIIRACKEMGIRSVAVYSDADSTSLHVKQADEAVNIGPPLSRKSYLNIDNIIRAALNHRAEAVHPGYGFLSENEAFARACAENQLVFIGPPPDCLSIAGDKSRVRQMLAKQGVSIIPGSRDIIATPTDAREAAEQVGYPVILKASGGGGGRGMRVAYNAKQVEQLFATASGEARAGFGNPDLYLEKYIPKPRHIEVQILGDAFGNYIHLGERECSIQKRYQKLIEECPSPFVDDALRAQLGETALNIARSIGYVNAGTIEFLVDQAKNHYFMEVNARVQVEHPVTEMVTGIDIVQQQIRLAAGEKLALKQADIQLNGAAIECRINAADPDNDFMPSPGTIEKLSLPQGPGIRIDSHIYRNYEISPFYDALIGKLIVWGDNRQLAIQRMREALTEFRIEGIAVTIPYYLKILKEKDFENGDLDTHFLDRFTK